MKLASGRSLSGRRGRVASLWSGGTSVAVLLAASAPPVSAQCVTSGTTAVCAGNLSDGFSLANLSSVTVGNLTMGVQPSEGRDGFDLANFVGQVQPGQNGGAAIAGTLVATMPTFGIEVTEAEAVTVFTMGGAGGGWDSESSPGGTTGQAGGAGGSGGDATLTISANTVSASRLAGPQSGSALFAYSMGGLGAAGDTLPNETGSTDPLTGGAGGAGGTGGNATVNAAVQVVQFSGPGSVIAAQSVGGQGGGTEDNEKTQIVADSSAFGGAGGDGGAGGAATVNLGSDGQEPIVPRLGLTGATGAGVLAQSIGGAGGDGMSAGSDSGEPEDGATGGNAGQGGDGGAVLVSGSLALSASVSGSFDAIRAESVGGIGGDGGDAYADAEQTGGNGGVGGGGGTAAVGTDDSPLTASITVTGDQGRGIYLRSVGAPGGSGGTESGSSVVGSNGAELGSGPGGQASANIQGFVRTNGDSAPALIVHSIGGFVESGSGFGGGTNSAGQGGAASATASLLSPDSEAAILTTGDNSHGVVVQSIGGGGGSAFGAVENLGALGATGFAGGLGGQASVELSGDGIATAGKGSRGVYVDSVGGGGGDAGPNTSVTVLGATGGTGGDGGAVNAQVDVAVTTTGNRSDGIFAASRGGGGGSATSTVGFESIGGGSGGGGGAGGTVTLEFSGAVSTAGADAEAAYAQSVGGGGGDGANALSGGLFFSQAIGGAGAGAGDGGDVTITQATGGGTASTSGDRARGVVAQSVGGGGGHGGSAVAGATGIGGSYSHALGGSGAGGGDGGNVSATLSGNVTTTGRLAEALYVQSVGGGGGTAGGAATYAVTFTGITVAHAVGGTGGAGGDAGTASGVTSGALTTSGDHSAGMVVEAIGGGGGGSGIVISGSADSFGSATADIGGSGGQGGDGGGVTASASGPVSTSGHASRGILAQSIGGGGGHGGTVVTGATLESVTVTYGLGGKGGVAGDGKATTVTAGQVTTSGQDSAAVAALSIGGGGGTGGLVLEGTAVSVADFDVSVGGTGASGGSGGDVTVTTTDAILTKGRLSEGVHAASLGGSGGAAGFGLGSAASANAVSAGSINLTLGGSGGAGGGSGDVLATIGGDVTTEGAHSDAVVAQSNAGGGGRAYAAAVANAVDVGNVSVTIGGSGGAGAASGTATINTAIGASISTASTHSRGLVAQSSGGTGGSGGFAAEISANISTPATEGVSGQVNVAVGGAGGTGGVAGAAAITNRATIATADYGSDAIYAQSIGGSGGAGGAVYAGNLSANINASVNVDVDVGGSGGGGGSSDGVTVSNFGNITTGGYESTGIFAQSVGGNGGRGGSTYSVLTQIGPGSPENLQVSVGGAGGIGALAGAVSVTNSGTIQTKKGGGDGIYAQSVGGNGGRGGSAGYLGFNLTPPVKYDNDAASFKLSVNVGHGGTGGGGADAAEVTVSNSAAISTEGDYARGIFAQSVGGGGGDGGTASAHSFAMSDICNVVPSGDYVCPGSSGNQSFSFKGSIQIGGTGGGSGDGKLVKVENSGAISTAGWVSSGIYAQSVGGGGGTGGTGGLGIQAWTSNKTLANIANVPGSFLPSFSSTNIAIGGGAGASGDGGDVEVTNTGAISVAGPDASVVSKYTGLQGGPADPLPLLAGGMGIFAQSVGGGGGDGGAGSSSLTAVVTVGQGGSDGGDGGDVTVSNSATITSTAGFSGVGILAQSVGGGGGTAGDVTRGWSRSWQNLNIGVGVGIQGNGGGGGDGGKVSVTSSGAITTSGTDSHGIIAQSVGGSGGMAGVKPVSKGSVGILVGSTGGSGDGGDVSVTVEAPITVSGTGAVGVAAHSASGTTAGDKSGTVAIGVQAAISATGSNGRGLLIGSSSMGDQATGAVTIALSSQGSVSTAGSGAEAIGVVDAGTGSGLTNAGLVSSGNDASYALRVDTAFDFAITNTGTITGSVLGTSADNTASAGSFDFRNEGLFNAGTNVTLGGAASEFASTGTISPGGVGNIATTGLSAASVSLSTDGIYQPDFDPGKPVTAPVVASDLLTITTSALTIAETTVAPNVVVSAPGSVAKTGSFLPFTSAESFAVSDFTAQSTGAVTYALASASGGTALEVSYVIDTTPWEGANSDRVPTSVAARVNANHNRFGEYAMALLTEPGDPKARGFLSEAGAYLLNRPDAAALLDSYDAFIADELLAVPDATLQSSLGFVDHLSSCDGDAAYVSRDGARCGWLRFFGRALNREAEGTGPSYDENVGGVALGAQFETDDATRYGAGLAWENGSISMASASGDVNRVQVGAFGSRDFGVMTVTATVSGGLFSSDLGRTVETPEGNATANSSPDGGFLAGHLEGRRRFDFGEVFVEPAADLGVTWLTQEGFSETGADGYGVQAGRLEQTTTSIDASVDIGRDFRATDGTGHVRLTAGVLGLIGADPSIEAAFVGAGDSAPSFTITDSQTDLYGQFAANLDVPVGTGARLLFDLGGLFASDQSSYGGGLRLSFAF